MDRPGVNRRMDFDEVQYEQLVNAAIAAVKGGDFQQARTLLTKATEFKPGDPEPWIWLSRATRDPAEQREYLEYALAADPGNATARRGLILLSGKVDASKMLTEGEGVAPRLPLDVQEGWAAMGYRCPQCGGRMLASTGAASLVCESCGHALQHAGDSVADQAEQVFDFVLPTERGHRWSEAEHSLRCEQCGAVSLLAVGQRLSACAYCGSEALLASTETQDLLAPQVIALFKLDQLHAQQCLEAWLGKGWFIPDDLKRLAKTSTLRPAYYPFWTFDGILEMYWHCVVTEQEFNHERKAPRNGLEFEMFDDELVSGLKGLSTEELAQVTPFDLKDVVPYHSALLAGHAVLAYDKPLSEAALEGRQNVARRLRRDLPNRILIGQSKQNIQTGAMNWSGMTFKHVLLPLWLGIYRYRGREFHLLINGQNGKVGGEKPVDRVKQAAFGAAVFLSVVVAFLILVAAGLYWGWFSF